MTSENNWAEVRAAYAEVLLLEFAAAFRRLVEAYVRGG